MASLNKYFGLLYIFHRQELEDRCISVTQAVSRGDVVSRYPVSNVTKFIGRNDTRSNDDYPHGDHADLMQV